MSNVKFFSSFQGQGAAVVITEAYLWHWMYIGNLLCSIEQQIFVLVLTFQHRSCSEGPMLVLHSLILVLQLLYIQGLLHKSFYCPRLMERAIDIA